MIKSFKDFVNESFSEEEMRQAEQDTMEYDNSLDADPNDYPDVEDDWAAEEEEEEEE